MTRYTNTAAGGTDGTTVTPANSGGSSGTAFNALYGTAPKYSATPGGGLWYAFQADSASTSIAEWTGLSAPAGSTLGVRASLFLTAYPTATTKIGELRTTASSGGAVIHIYLTSAGKLQINDVTANGNSTVTKVFANALALNTSYDLAAAAVPNASTTGGGLQFAYFLSSSPTAAVETAYTSSSSNVGGTTLTGARFGKLTATSWTTPFYMRNLVAQDSGSGLPAKINVPPTVSAGGDKTIALGATATIVGSGTDPDGTVTSRTWTCTQHPGTTGPDISNVVGASTTVTLTVTPTIAGIYKFQLAYVDDGGATSTDTMTLTVTSSAAPTAAAALNPNYARIDATGSSPGSGGTLSFTISPSTGTIQPTAGVFYALRGASDVTYTITATESGSGATDTKTVTVPAASSNGTFTGGYVGFDLPTPGDAATKDQWGPELDDALVQIRDKINELIGYFSS